MAHLVGWEHILPVCASCLKGSRSLNYRKNLRKALLEELGLKPPENEQNIQEDPYLILGYGVEAYMDIMISLAKLYAMLTIISIPLILIYIQGSALDGSSLATLGNLGSASMFCEQYRTGRGPAEIECPANTYYDASKVVFGLMSSEFE